MGRWKKETEEDECITACTPVHIDACMCVHKRVFISVPPPHPHTPTTHPSALFLSLAPLGGG